MQADLAECGSTRAQVAADLSRLSGRSITLAQVDAWVAPSHHQHRVPLEMVPAWVFATGSARLIEMVAEVAGLALATEEDRQYAEYGRVSLRREKLQRVLMERD